MSLTVNSSNTALDALIKDLIADKNVSIADFQKIRDSADEELSKLLPQSDGLQNALSTFQSLADDLSEKLQVVTKEVRAAKPDADALDALRKAVEYQLAYIVLTYGATLDRYILTNEAK